MPVGFVNVPDWFSWDNQGAGIAVAGLEAGRSDLVVLMVDNPPGVNSGLFRVGRGLSLEGDVAQGWTPWQPIPGWFSWENQGAGVAVADLDDDGRPELIVFMVDNPPEQNQGYYRIGRRLDADGDVTGGWSDWIPVPDWFSWENQYAGIAVADLDDDGRPELIVFMVDNPPEQNQGYYRIGRRLDTNGDVTGGWSEWVPVPDWFSWENQAAGVAVAELDETGMPGLVVFQVDSPPGQNQAFYKIGKNLTVDGSVRGGWSSWLGVPEWFAWENQGGGIAARTSNGQQDLIFLMVDAPAEQNSGLYRVLPLTEDPATQGKWELMPYLSEVLAVHGAVLPTGKVLFFAGSGNSLTRFDSPRFGDESQGIWTSVVWDPALPPDGGANFFHPLTPRDEHGRPFDFFCCGHAFLADGNLLVAGGTLDYDRHGHGFLGLTDALVFDVTAQQWTVKADMARGRWYPTLTTLGDGQVLAASGLLDTTGFLNDDLEVYNAGNDAWQLLPKPEAFPGLPLYAHLFLLIDGRVFFSGGRMDDPSPLGPCVLDLTTSPVHVTPVAGLAEPQNRNQSASVLLPPAQDQRVMIAGGGPLGHDGDATDSVDVVDLTAAAPAYQAAAPLNLARVHLNAIVLPDHTVLVSGGSLKKEHETVARRQCEIYDPATNSWTLGATAQVPRLYHSIALLLPDGRVAAAGSNPARGDQDIWIPPDENEELQIEIYSPPYLFKGPRPQIDNAPTNWRWGQTVQIDTPQAGAIRWVSLISPGATTHAFDSSQRLVDLTIISQQANHVRATVTANPNLAPPGWYMLFVVGDDGIPSTAKWIHLGP
jgi:hypothetical protein